VKRKDFKEKHAKGVDVGCEGHGRAGAAGFLDFLPVQHGPVVIGHRRSSQAAQVEAKVGQLALSVQHVHLFIIHCSEGHNSNTVSVVHTTRTTRTTHTHIEREKYQDVGLTQIAVSNAAHVEFPQSEGAVPRDVQTGVQRYLHLGDVPALVVNAALHLRDDRLEVHRPREMLSHNLEGDLAAVCVCVCVSTHACASVQATPWSGNTTLLLTCG